MLRIKPIILKGNWIELEPLNEIHRKELYVAAQDERIWTLNGSKAYGDKFHHWFDDAMNCYQNRTQLPFVIRSSIDKRVIGSTRFYDIHSDHLRVAIGYTWIIPEMWGTYVNPESKLLILKHAFDDLNMNRVAFFTDVRNKHSQAAIKKLGAKAEGIMRQHMVLEGGVLRDTMYFSIIKPEWTAVKKALEKRVKKFSTAKK